MLRRFAPRLCLGRPAVLLALVLACAPGASARAEAPGPPRAPRAVVLLLGDGLGFSQIALARYATKGRSGRFAFESMPVTGLVSTWSASNFVTDSGAAATAFSAGVKTDNRFLGLDSERRSVRTIGEAAKAAGWRVGQISAGVGRRRGQRRAEMPGRGQRRSLAAHH